MAEPANTVELLCRACTLPHYGEKVDILGTPTLTDLYIRLSASHVRNSNRFLVFIASLRLEMCCSVGNMRWEVHELDIWWSFVVFARNRLANGMFPICDPRFFLCLFACPIINANGKCNDAWRSGASLGRKGSRWPGGSRGIIHRI